MRLNTPFAGLAGSLIFAMLPGAAAAAAPTVDVALQLSPMQRDVEYDRPSPDGVAKCTVKAEKAGGKTGWVVRDASGEVLRNFVDTNGDQVVDQWSYFKEGIEIYRDIDSTFNGKADQYRWLNTAGTRWGLDTNEDGKIDSWKVISAEEVTAEVVAALRDKDAARFERLLATPQELKTLGLGAAKAAEIAQKVQTADEGFRELSGSQKYVTRESKWVYFGGGRPSLVPAGTGESTGDLVVYENVAAMVETGGKHGQVPIGTLVRIGDAWRMVGAPQPDLDGPAQGVFVAAAGTDMKGPDAAATGPSPAMQELIKELEEVDAAAAKEAPEDQAELNGRRADILEELAKASKQPQDRAQWIKQFADTVSTSVQAQAFPDGVERLAKLHASLKENAADAELAAYVRYRHLVADYAVRMAAPDVKYEAIQEEWRKELESYVEDNPKSPDSADAVLQLAIACEFSGDEEKAVTWYEHIIKNFRESEVFEKAQGAKRRLESVGKPIALRGPGFDPKGQKVTVDLDKFKGRGVVLIQYWATWAEPAKADMPQIKEMLQKYGSDGFFVIGVSLDNDLPSLRAYLQQNRLPWPQIYEPGGLNNRLANEMGILTLPAMILVDRDGKVINRNVHASALETELKAVLRPAPAQAQRKPPAQANRKPSGANR